FATERGRAGRRGRAQPQSADIWQLRARPPADVLREIGLADTEERAAAGPGHPSPLSKVAGEVRTVTDVAAGDTSLSRAAVGVHGGLPNGWAYNLQGDYAALPDSPAAGGAGPAPRNSTGAAPDVAPASSEPRPVTA